MSPIPTSVPIGGPALDVAVAAATGGPASSEPAAPATLVGLARPVDPPGSLVVADLGSAVGTVAEAEVAAVGAAVGVGLGVEASGVGCAIDVAGVAVGVGVGFGVGFGVGLGVAGGSGGAGGAMPGTTVSPPSENDQPSTVPGGGVRVLPPSVLATHDPPRAACQYDQ